MRPGLAQLLLQACVLAAIAVLSYVGGGWGYLLVYAFLLLILAIVIAGLDVSMRLRGLPAVRRGELRARALRSFALAEAAVAVALVITAGAVRGLDHPIGMFAGGALSGDLMTEPVDDWSFASREEEELQLQIGLQTPGVSPYSITTHFAVVEGRLYIGADFLFPFKQWVHRVAVDDRVLVKVGDRLYPRRAVRVRDAQEHAAVFEEAARRVGADPEDFAAEVWFFRMDPST